MTTLRAAIFDMDGLLIDSERVIMTAWIEAAAELGIALSTGDFVTVIGRSGPESTATLTAMVGGPEAFRTVRTSAARRISADGQGFPLKPGARRLLEALQARRIPCAVASSTHVREIRRRLDAVGVFEHFTAAAGGDEVARGKPDPAVYQLAAQRLGVPPEQCLGFEDSENGARAAIAAGLTLVHVPDLCTLDAAVQARCDRVLGSLDQAVALLPGWFGAA